MKIAHQPEDKCFIAFADDGSDVGSITYEEGSAGWLRATHTYVNPENRGQGIAGLLVDALVEYAISRNAKIEPVCPYVEKVFNSHPDRYRQVMG